MTDFYRGTGTDAEGRGICEIWSWSDDELEAVHDFIQWLFPLSEPSAFNPDAPLLTRDDIALFHGDALLRVHLRKSLERILSFLGLTATLEGKVVEGPNFAIRAPEVWQTPNHNWLRISRILRSLTLLGLRDEAEQFFNWLDHEYTRRRFPIPADTFRYWSNAVNRTA